jgi:lambda family phage portal protein
MSKPHLRAKMVADGFHSHGRTAHDGASLTAHDVASWNPPRRSADAEIIPEWGTLVGRTRDFDRNNPLAKGAKQTIVDNVVGTGPMLLSDPDWKALGESPEWALEWSEALERKFHAWWWSTACHAADILTGDQIVQQMQAAQIMNGDALVLPLWLPDRGDGYATKLQVVETDRLSNPWGAPDGPYLRGGVARDIYGMPLGYHVRKTDPGDFRIGGYASLIDDWEYVPRRTEFGRLRAIHFYDQERSGQTRGKPMMTSLVPLLKQADRYIRAEVDAAVANGLVAGVMTTPLDREDVLDLFSKDAQAYLRARNEHAVTIQGGKIMTAFPGDKFESFIPGRPNPQFGTFLKNLLMIAACGLDMPYEMLAKDWSNTTYTSGRMSLLEMWRSFNRRRGLIASGLLNPIVDLFAEEQAYAGAIEVKNFEDPIRRAAYLRCDWIFPGRGWVDPVREAVGAATRLANNISTFAKECAEQGLYWRDVLRQRAIEMKFCESLGLPFVAATSVRVTSAETPNDAGELPAPGDQTGPDQPKKPNPNAIVETIEIAINA